jgi:uncharacterized membrane protein YkoI
MKRSLTVVSSVLIACTFAASPMGAASERENKRLHEGKITKNEAQHLVLRKFPGSTIKKCELTNGQDHSVWVVDLVKAGSHDTTTIRVDGRSGKILP